LSGFQFPDLQLKAQLGLQTGIGQLKDLPDPFREALLSDQNQLAPPPCLPHAEQEQGQAENVISVEMGDPDRIQGLRIRQGGKEARGNGEAAVQEDAPGRIALGVHEHRGIGKRFVARLADP